MNDFATVKNKTGSTMNAGAVVVDTFGQINNYEGATLTYASVDADGIVRNQGTLNVTGTYVVGDEGETTLDGESTIGTLAVGRTSKLMLLRATAMRRKSSIAGIPMSMSLIWFRARSPLRRIPSWQGRA